MAKKQAKLRIKKAPKARKLVIANPVGDPLLTAISRAANDDIDPEVIEAVRRNYGDMPRLSKEELTYQDDREEARPSRKAIKNLSDVAEELIYIDTHPFRFQVNYKNVRTGESEMHNREYLRPLYDMFKKYPQGSRNQIWCTSRQCIRVDQKVTMAGEGELAIGDLSPGDWVSSVNVKTGDVAPKRVKSVFPRSVVECYCVVTATGKRLVAGHDHPVFTDGGWVAAEKLKPGSVVAITASVEDLGPGRISSWDIVESVTACGEFETVDIEVEDFHTFVAEGIVVSNCEKSTTMSSKSITLGVIYDAFKTLFISPRFDQVSVFSGQRFKPMAEDSPVMRENYLDTARCLWQVGQREFKNRSFFNFRSCYATADGSRGITAHHLAIDEIQDIISDNIPVLEECQSHYGWDTGLRFRTYAGTPKSLNNTITKRFNESCRFEMLIKCQACGHWNYPDEKIVGLKHYICTKCGKEIFPKLHGQWVPMNPSMLDKCWGFRITQITVPFKTHADIKEKMDDPLVSQAKFFNECLGLPYDSGEMVLSEAVLREACDQDRAMMTPAQTALLAPHTPIFAGLDHGSGEGDNPAYTALTIGRLDGNGKFEVLYMKRFIGKDSALSTQPGLINEICRAAGVSAMMADWGFGAHQNARLVDEYGWSWDIGDHVLMQCQYVNQNAFAKFDNDSFRYRIDRTESMERTITAIRNGTIRFFNFGEFQQFIDDFVSIFVEFNETTGRSKFDHVDNDDCFHSVSYAYMAALQFSGQLIGSDLSPDGFLQPGQPDPGGFEYDGDDYP